jgi:hypothetical protein
MIRYKAVPDYPIMVTRWMASVVSLAGWKKFLDDKGFETIIINRTLKYDTGDRPFYTLCRKPSEEESVGIANGKYQILSGFLCYTRDYFTKSHKMKSPVEFTCIRCGKEDMGYQLDGRNLCKNCKIMAMDDCSDGLGFSIVEFKGRT